MRAIRLYDTRTRQLQPLVPRDPGKVVWEDAHQVVAEAGGRRF